MKTFFKEILLTNEIQDFAATLSAANIKWNIDSSLTLNQIHNIQLILWGIQ